jgi:hypothetical protein
MNTTIEPVADEFAKFVRAFLDAVGQKDHISERHLIEMIEDALVQGRK